MVKTMFKTNMFIPLPKVLIEDQYHSMFFSIFPTYCDLCGTILMHGFCAKISGFPKFHLE